MSCPPYKIAICGAGPAGLTLARLLHLSKVNMEVTVYELDLSPTSRPDQGGTLDLHTGSGLAAIEKCDLWDAFRKHARYDAQSMVIADKNATKLLNLGDSGEEKNPSHERPEIDRGKLKQILLESVPSEWIRWGHHLKEVTEEGMLRFNDSEKATEGPFDLVVGADGAWSKVRSRLHAIKPSYSGVSGYEMKIQDAAKTCPHVDKLVGKGAYCALMDGKWINAQRLGDESIEIRTFFTCPDGEAKERLDKMGREATLEYTLQEYHDWAPEILEFLKQADINTMKAWTLYELPVGSTWQHLQGFTLIGDAASLATPFAGQGVNKALTDALELADCFERMLSPSKAGKHTLDEAVLAYEKQMFPRAKKMQTMTMVNKINAFASGAPVSFIVGIFKMMFEESESWWVRMLGSAPVLALATSYFSIQIQVGWAVRTFWRRC